MFREVFFGVLSSLLLLGFYFLILNFISGWDYALEQFESFKFYILSLAIGFGIQVGLYVYLKNLIKNAKETKALAVSGTTSTLAMISCCSHYLINALPVIGVTGFITIVAQYQIEIFWLGLLANILGIGYMLSKLIKFKDQHLS